MNVFEKEAQNVVNCLIRHGYNARLGVDHVIVRDPVNSYCEGHRVYFVDVAIRDWPEAMRFLCERE